METKRPMSDITLTQGSDLAQYKLHLYDETYYNFCPEDGMAAKICSHDPRFSWHWNTKNWSDHEGYFVILKHSMAE